MPRLPGCALLSAMIPPPLLRMNRPMVTGPPGGAGSVKQEENMGPGGGESPPAAKRPQETMRFLNAGSAPEVVQFPIASLEGAQLRASKQRGAQKSRTAKEEGCYHRSSTQTGPGFKAAKVQFATATQTRGRASQATETGSKTCPARKTGEEIEKAELQYLLSKVESRCRCRTAGSTSPAIGCRGYEWLCQLSPQDKQKLQARRHA